MKCLFLSLCHYLYKSLLNSNMIWRDRRTWLSIQSLLAAAAKTEVVPPRRRDCDDYTFGIVGVDIRAPVSRVLRFVEAITV